MDLRTPKQVTGLHHKAQGTRAETERGIAHTSTVDSAVGLP